MAEFTHRARKRFGQNFLQDTAVIDRILAAVLHPSRDAEPLHLVEIGPGQGALTLPLAQQLKTRPATHLSLIELDRDLAAYLREQFNDNPQISLIEADALNYDFCHLLKQQAPPVLTVFGNLPYNISTPLIFHLLEQLNASDNTPSSTATPLFSRMTFMLQKEVVDRLCATPNTKAYGRISVMTQLYCYAEKLFDVPPSAFKPQPKVTSSIVQLRPRSDRVQQVKNTALFATVVKASFAQRRKTLRNNFAKLLDASGLESIGIDPTRRAETLSLEEFIAISHYLDDRQDEILHNAPP